MDQFHFLQPLWLITLLPLLLIVWFVFRTKSDSKAWEKIIDPNLLPLLLQGEDRDTGKAAKFLLAMAWLVSVLALADPVWEKVPRPVFQTNAARVIVLDLSNSMLIDDLKPNRLARARFKVEDILSREEEGQTGLVLFAGDAFTASPLTRDTETIRSLLKILNPQLMPAQGSRADLGLLKAHELFKQAGINNGQVLLIADGVSRSNAAIDATQALVKDGHSVSVLGVGTDAGGKLKFRNQQTVSVKLDAKVLQEIANSGRGNYHLISTNNADLQQVLSKKINSGADKAGNSDLDESQNEDWKSTGPILLLFVLPLAALAFRRGWLLNICFVFVGITLFVQPQPAMAAPLEDKWQSFWQTLSQNQEQRAHTALQKKQYGKASEISKDPLRVGSAEYNLKKYDEALKSFKQAKGADARYNEGNTLAKLKKYEEAVAAYDEALKIQADMKDAIENKAAVEALLKQQKEQQKNSGEQPSKENQQQDKQASKDQKNQDKNSQSEDDKSDKEKLQSDEEGAQKSAQDQKENGKGKENKEDQDNQFSDANKALNDKEDESDKPETKEKSQASKEQQEQNQDDQKLAEKAEGTNVDAEELTKEEKMAAEQWLRRIPDDPGGLLRRKFKSQYKQRRRNSDSTEQPW